MIRSYFTIAFRNLWRHKLHTAINVIGLAIGISACMAIYQIVRFEEGFDTFHADKERIYRVYSRFSGAFTATNRGVTAALHQAARKEMTGLEAVVGFHTYTAEVKIPTAQKTNKKLESQSDIIITEPQYFDVFSSYQWLSGSPQSALTQPFQVVLTEKKAKLYFGVRNPVEAVGREIRYNDSLVLTVSGIVKDFDSPSDLYFGDFISFATIGQSWLKDKFNLANWESTNSSSQVFIKLAKATSAKKIENQLVALSKLYAEKNKEADWTTSYQLQPLSDLHFNTELSIFDNRGRVPAHRPTLRILMLVAGVLLLIACINFINLATAQALQRSKEVGVRKVLGSTRYSLIRQFLGETLLVTLLAVILAVGLADLGLRFFKEFIPEGVSLHLTQPQTWLFLTGVTLVVTLLSGFYPAFVLSSFLPVLALRNQSHIRRSGLNVSLLRKGLIVVQFSFSLLLIAGTLIMGRQIHYLLHKDMGFTTDAIVYFYTPWQAPADKIQVIKNQVAALPEILKSTLHESTPAENGYSSSIMTFKNKDGEKKLNVHRKFGDPDFIDLYQIKLIAGRNVYAADSLREFVVNETLAKQLGFQQPAAALNQLLWMNDRAYPIVGVVKDFHIQPLRQAIEPTVIACELGNMSCISLQLATKGRSADDVKAAMDKVGKIWKEVYPNEPFDYAFLDETIASFYESEQRTSKLMQAATAIAIFISCIGLFGLVSFTVARRTKEIGIRKILGASIANIVTLLSKDFVWLVLLAMTIAFPLAWWGTSRWLENFAYRVDIQWWMFALAGLAALGIALLTVSFQAVRAAAANPVESLRSE